MQERRPHLGNFKEFALHQLRQQLYFASSLYIGVVTDVNKFREYLSLLEEVAAEKLQLEPFKLKKLETTVLFIRAQHTIHEIVDDYTDFHKDTFFKVTTLPEKDFKENLVEEVIEPVCKVEVGFEGMDPHALTKWKLATAALAVYNSQRLPHQTDFTRICIRNILNYGVRRMPGTEEFSVNFELRSRSRFEWSLKRYIKNPEI